MLTTTLMEALEAETDRWHPGHFARTLYARHTSASTCWEEVRLSPFHQTSLAALKRKAEAFGNSTAASLPYSLYSLFETTGNRVRYEAAYFEHRARLNTWALMAMAGDPQAPARLEDAIWAVCDEYTWCLPAHLSGRGLWPEGVAGGDGSGGKGNPGSGKGSGEQGKPGESMPKAQPWVRPHDREVDLFAAETACALAEICALLEDRLSPLVVARARQLVFSRVLDALLAPGPAFVWETLSNNWSAVCAGSVGVAAMYLIPDARTLVPVLRRCLDAMDVFLSGFAEDGACTEGLGYWNYGFGFFVMFAERLRARTGGRVDLLTDGKVHAIALFQQRVWLGGEQVVSFSDGAREGRWQPGVTHFLTGRFPDVISPDPAYVQCFGDDICHRWMADVRNFLWADPGKQVARSAHGKEETVPDTGEGATRNPDADSAWFPDAAWLVSRTPGGAVFAAKGGHNDEPHNHNDLGTFLLHANGETFLDDTGAGEYTRDYFGPGRYGLLVNRSGGHSVPMIGETEQSPGKDFHADVIQMVQSARQDVLALDLTAAYAEGVLRSLTRTFLWDKGECPTLTLEDRIVQAAPQPVRERFVTFLEPIVSEDGVRIQGTQACLRIRCMTPGFEVALQSETFNGHRGESERLWKIDFHHASPDGDCPFQAVFDWV